MTTYTQLHENVDNWYDYLNDSFNHIQADNFCDGTHYPRFAQYFYCYLSCIEEFSDHE